MKTMINMPLKRINSGTRATMVQVLKWMRRMPQTKMLRVKNRIMGTSKIRLKMKGIKPRVAKTKRLRRRGLKKGCIKSKKPRKT